MSASKAWLTARSGAAPPAFSLPGLLWRLIIKPRVPPPLLALLEGDRIVDLRWRAHGCPATYAVAASAHHALKGVAIAEAPSILRQALAQLGDLSSTERHAEAMFCRAMAAARSKAGE